MNTDSAIESLVTLVFVTIGRNDAARRFVASVRQRYPGLPILAADQNGPTDEMECFYRDHSVRMLWLPFDCGLSFARNRAFEQVGTRYVLLADDDFVFTDRTQIGSALDVLEEDPELGFLGGSVVDVRTDEHGNEKRLLRRWEKFFVRCERANTLITIPLDHLPLQTRLVSGHTVYLCDMTSNWGLFRAEMLSGDIRWDERIKVNGEHEDFFLNLKQNSSWRVGFLPGLQCDHRQPKNPTYQKLRRRLQGRKLLARKWNLTHHLEIGVGLRSYSDYLAFSEVPVDHPELYDPDGEGGVKFLPAPVSRRGRGHPQPPDAGDAPPSNRSG
jgi:hypothetical protein